MKKALITGGAGFIGFFLAKRLADDGQEVTIVDNFKRGAKDQELLEFLKRDNVKVIEMDITKKEEFSKLKDTYDYIYHLAAINGTENFYKMPDEVLKVGVLGTLNMLDYFTEKKYGKLLFSSSSETYAGALRVLGDKFPIPTPENVPLMVEDPTNVRWSYGGGKIIGEIACACYAQAKGMKNYTIIRYHNIYGPRMGTEHVIPQFIERIIKKETPFKIYGGDETRTFCYIDDAVTSTKEVMESEKTNGQTIHIGRSHEEIEIKELAKKLFNIGNVNPEIEIQNAPKGSVKRRCPDISKLKALTDFKASIGLDEGLKKTFEWYEKYYTGKLNN